MKEDKYCIVCGNPYPEEHHIVFRGQQQAMINCPHNTINLCYEHHRGNESPHMKREIDIKYKLDLQNRLIGMFSFKEIFTEDEVKRILLIPKKDAHKLIKSLTLSINGDEVGYMGIDIVKEALGGRFYG